MSAFHHVTVLLHEAVELLNVKEDGIYFDLTMGGGGHSAEILRRLTTGRLIGVDRDEKAIETCTERFRDYGERFTPWRESFAHIEDIAQELGIQAIDGIIMDLGVSSPQLDEAERGFSYMQSAPLDMRMDRRQTKTAQTVVNEYAESELCRILYEYGEERWAARIAKFIVAAREEKTIETTGELVDIIKKAIPKGAREEGGHPAKRTFQAIRIEVNDELGELETALASGIKLLKSGGRMSVITFHSLEDRMVKNKFQAAAKGCTCPKEFPICVCGKVPEARIITRKPTEPSAEEMERNSRAKSARLRAIEKI